LYPESIRGLGGVGEVREQLGDGEEDGGGAPGSRCSSGRWRRSGDAPVVPWRPGSRGRCGGSVPQLGSVRRGRKRRLRQALWPEFMAGSVWRPEKRREGNGGGD
jgi:hypothetical protein